MTDDTTPIPTTPPTDPLARFDEALPVEERALPLPDGIEQSAELLRVWVNGAGDVQIMCAAPGEGESDHPDRGTLWGEVLAAVVQILANSTVPEEVRRKWIADVAGTLTAKLEERA